MGGWSPVDLLPAALVLAAGAALAWGARRWYDPVPRPTLAAWALLLAVLFGPVLAGGRVLLPLGTLVGSVPFRHLEPPRPPTVALQSDLVVQILPWQSRVRAAVTAGRWPLWNDLAGAGMPLMGDPQAQAFQPLVLATYPLPLRHAPAVTAALRVLLAMAGTFLLLRRQGLGTGAATFGSVAYGAGGPLLLWLGWPLATSLALLPLLLYGVVRCARDGGRRDVALLAAASFATLLGGHPETILYAAGAAGILVLALARERRRGGLPPAPLVRRVLAAALLAAALAAPVLVAARDFLPRTERSAAVATATRSLAAVRRDLGSPGWWQRWRSQASRNLVPFAAGRALGDHERGYWGVRNYVEDGSAFAGTVVLVLALAGCGAAGRRFPGERLAQLLTLATLLLVVQPPGFAHVVARLPVVGATAAHQNHRLVPFAAFALVCLAACELERWRGGEPRRRQLLAAAAATAALLAWAYLAHRRPGTDALLAGSEARWLGLQAGVLAAAVVAALAAARSWRRLEGRRLPWVLALVAVGELLAFHRPLLRSGPAELFYPRPPPLRFLAERLGDQRLAGLGPTFPPNYAQVYGLADVRIDGPSRPADYAEVLAVLQPPGVRSMPQMFWVRRPRHPVQDLLGVRYVLAPPGARVELPLALRHPTGWVFERPTALPRLFLPAAAQRGADWRGWLARNPDFAGRALVAELPARAAGRGGWRARRPCDATVAVSVVEPERLAARVRLAEPRLLASSVLADPGWRLLVDGARHRTVLTNGPFVAAWLPRRARAVELLYRPPGFVFACGLAAIAAAAALGALLRPPRDLRRR